MAVIDGEYAEVGEDYPDQRREISVNDAVERAVSAADRIILEASDGSCEETDYLTARVAERLVDKVAGRVQSVYLAYRLRLREGRKS